MTESANPPRSLVGLAVLYWLSLSLAATFFYIYVLFPAWLAFAYWAMRSSRTPEQARMARFLALIVVVWILAAVPFFLFITVTAALFFGAMALAMLLGAFLMYSTERLAFPQTPSMRPLLRLGLLAGIATPLAFLGRLVYLLLTPSSPIPEFGPVNMSEILQLIALSVSIVSGVAFLVAARRSRPMAVA